MAVGVAVEAGSGAVAVSLSSVITSRQEFSSCRSEWVISKSASFHCMLSSSNLELSLEMESWNLLGLSVILSWIFLLSRRKSSNPLWTVLRVRSDLASCLTLDIDVVNRSSARSSASKKASSSSSPGRNFWASSSDRLKPASVLLRVSRVCWMVGVDKAATSSGSVDGMFCS